MDLVYNSFEPDVEARRQHRHHDHLPRLHGFTPPCSRGTSLVLHYHNHSVTAGTDIPLVIPHRRCCSASSSWARRLVRLRTYITGKFD